MISAVKWYWGNCIEILPPSIVTGACRSQSVQWAWLHESFMTSCEYAADLLLNGRFLLCLLLTHLEFGAHHCRQLTFLTNAELVGPGPVGNGLCPGEVVPILNHLRYHFLVCLGVEKPCDRAGEIPKHRNLAFKWMKTHIYPFKAYAWMKKILIPIASRNSSYLSWLSSSYFPVKAMMVKETRGSEEGVYETNKRGVAYRDSLSVLFLSSHIYLNMCQTHMSVKDVSRYFSKTISRIVFTLQCCNLAKIPSISLLLSASSFSRTLQVWACTVVKCSEHKIQYISVHVTNVL